MDDLSDPREAPRDRLAEEFGALTDEEDGDGLTPREREILREAEEIRQRKLGSGPPARTVQVETTPSPKRSVLPPSPERLFRPAKLTYEESDHSLHLPQQTEAKGTTSYFLDVLENSRAKITEEAKQLKEFASSRVYTFGEGITVKVEEVDELEKVSGQEISKRYIRHDDLVEAFKEIKVMRINKLMAKVCPPDFEEPKYPNWCVVGILTSKSEPKITANNSGRFIILNITDFKYTVDIFLFDKAIEKYNKLRVGDIIAVLNPTIRVKKYEGVESFTLNIQHSMDCILEIGKAKNLGQCRSLRKDGTRCPSFVNRANEIYCTFHKERRVAKAAGSRMEFQTSYRVNAPVKNGVKQSMILGKPDPHFKGNIPQVRIVDDLSAPKTDRVSQARSHFKDNKTHRAFFNTGYGYEDLNEKKLEDKKKKDREARLKDAILQKKLEAKFREGKKLAKVYGKQEDFNEDIEKRRSLLTAAFNKESLTNIGFDPSARSTEKGLLSRTNNSETDVISELREVTKNKKIDLGVDKDELMRRKREREEAEETMKRLNVAPSSKSTIYRVKGEVKREMKRKVKKEVKKERENVKKEVEGEVYTPVPNANDLNFSDSSDDDLEIARISYKKFKEDTNN